MAHSRLYVRLMNSKRWRDLRNDWLSDHPECELCKREGRVTLAQCVHHITPVESGRTDMECEDLAFNRSGCNLMSLCYECHAQVHKAERSHSKQQHHDRERERLERWVSRLRGESTEDPRG